MADKRHERSAKDRDNQRETDEPAVTVSMGDSYISGEGGRWVAHAAKERKAGETTAGEDQDKKQ
ncbi:hypothetical protein [Streptomyces sp. NPDC021622]|uniref:hypothetical protein n=1 Tax=Streptomyces sp. NPDC021622 TaxID=3155013 RepID=UPI0034067A8A